MSSTSDTPQPVPSSSPPVRRVSPQQSYQSLRDLTAPTSHETLLSRLASPQYYNSDDNKKITYKDIYNVLVHDLTISESLSFLTLSYGLGLFHSVLDLFKVKTSLSGIDPLSSKRWTHSDLKAINKQVVQMRSRQWLIAGCVGGILHSCIGHMPQLYQLRQDNIPRYAITALLSSISWAALSHLSPLKNGLIITAVTCLGGLYGKYKPDYPLVFGYTPNDDNTSNLSSEELFDQISRQKTNI